MQYLKFTDGEGTEALLVLPDGLQEPATLDFDLRFDEGSLQLSNDEQEHTAEEALGFILTTQAQNMSAPKSPASPTRQIGTTAHELSERITRP